jgi:uncharacterized protein (TIRG00374 family)
MDGDRVSPTKTIPRNQNRIWLRRAFSLIVLGLLLYFFWPLLGEIKAAAILFRSADWIWFFVAIVVQVFSYSALTWLNALSLQPFSGRIGFIQLAGVLTSMAFIAVAIPSAGISGIAMRIHLLRKYGYYPEESLFSLAVETILEAIALVSVALIGLGYLIQSGGFTLFNVLGLVVIAVLLAGVLFITWRILSDYQRSYNVLHKFGEIWNRFSRFIQPLDIDQLDDRLVFFNKHLKDYPLSSLWKFPLSAYGKVSLDVLTMGVCFQLFGYTIAPATLLIGYGLTLTLSGLTVLPGGLVMTDAIVPVIFSRLGVPGPVAIAAGLTYRLIAFWFVRFAGYISWLILERRK